MGFLDHLFDLEREVVTRAQARKQAADEVVDQHLSEQDGAQPIAVEGVDSDDECMEEADDSTSDPASLTGSEEEALLEATVDNEQTEEGLCLPVPELADDLRLWVCRWCAGTRVSVREW
jgi:hypothetical protein